jgi:chloramphenicol 3-O phosphotransferase
VSEGTVVYLNGTSSSGKTTLAGALHQILPGPWLRVEGDYFFTRLSHPEPWTWTIEAVVSAIHAFTATAAASGLNAIVDGLLVNRTWLKDAAERLAERRAYLVAVRCSAAELDRRERARGDRHLGNAREQLPFVHAHGLYDFEVDTSRATPVECAAAIVEWLLGAPEPSAFRRLRDSALLRDEAAYAWALLRGSTGPAVRWLQEDLQCLGYDPGPADGVFGVRTETALRALQEAHGLSADGMIILPPTITAIVEALGRPVPGGPPRRRVPLHRPEAGVTDDAPDSRQARPGGEEVADRRPAQVLRRQGCQVGFPGAPGDQAGHRPFGRPPPGQAPVSVDGQEQGPRLPAPDGRPAGQGRSGAGPEPHRAAPAPPGAGGPRQA